MGDEILVSSSHYIYIRMKSSLSLSLIIFGLLVLLALSAVWAKEEKGNSLSEELAEPRVARSQEAGKRMKKKMKRNGKGKKRMTKKAKKAEKGGKKTGKKRTAKKSKTTGK